MRHQEGRERSEGRRRRGCAQARPRQVGGAGDFGAGHAPFQQVSRFPGVCHPVGARDGQPHVCARYQALVHDRKPHGPCAGRRVFDLIRRKTMYGDQLLHPPAGGPPNRLDSQHCRLASLEGHGTLSWVGYGGGSKLLSNNTTSFQAHCTQMRRKSQISRRPRALRSCPRRILWPTLGRSSLSEALSDWVWLLCNWRKDCFNAYSEAIRVPYRVHFLAVNWPRIHSPDLAPHCRGPRAPTGAPRPPQPAGLPPRRHPRPPPAHGVAHRLSGGRRADPLPPRLPPHRRPQPDPRQRPRARRHAPDRPQDPRHLRPLQHRQRAGTARGWRPARRLSGAARTGDAAWRAAPPGPHRRPAHRAAPSPRATHHRVSARG